MVIMIFVITVLTGSRLPAMEQKDMGIYRSFGFTAGKLRISFAMWFGLVSSLGALAGILCSVLFTDTLVAALFRMYGISNFSSHLTLGNMLVPAFLVILAFTVFAWFISRKIGTDKLTQLFGSGA